MLSHHFLYTDELTPAEVIAKIQTVLCRATANQDVWADARMDWHNFIHRVAFEWGVNPAWLLVSLQRERSLFGQVGDAKDFEFAQGFVGQDGPGTVNTKWNGLPTQLFLAARGTAWLAGRGGAFGWRPGLIPTVPRWKQGGSNTVQLLNDDHSKGEVYECPTLAEFVQLSYTPHLKALEVNQSILERWAPEFI